MKLSEELKIDPRKWNVFLVKLEDHPNGMSTPAIWELRLSESLQQLKFVIDYFPVGQFPRMLIIGAGVGAEVKAAMMLGYKATGIGLLIPEQLAYARNQGVDMRLMDMHDLKFPNESFDIVYCSQTLEHCTSPWHVCVEVWATLRAGGRWWINLPLDPQPAREHFMILPASFYHALFKCTGFRELSHVEDGVANQYLLEKLKLSESQATISDFLNKRLTIGNEYGGN